jgi:hypothetical protein
VGTAAAASGFVFLALVELAARRVLLLGRWWRRERLPFLRVECLALAVVPVVGQSRRVWHYRFEFKLIVLIVPNTFHQE